jgi:surface polysaccharide O-acyltransferase-like enzyme
MRKTDHYQYIDGLRVLAIVAVVVIHASSNITNSSPTVSMSWQMASMLNLALRWAVPVFVMISGALLLSKKDESMGVFFQKRLNRLLLPAGFFILVYFWWQNRGGYVLTVGEYAKRVLVWGNPYYHLYFLYVIIGLYLVTPALRVLVQYMTKRQLGLLTILLLLMTAYWSYVVSYFGGNFPRDTLTVVTHFLPYVGYYLAGYWIHTYWQGKSLTRGWLVALLLWFVAVVLTTYGYSQWGYSAKSMMFEDYAGLNVVLMSLLIFAGFKQWYEEGKKSNSSWVVRIAGASFGLYLLHVMILEWLAGYFRRIAVSNWGLVIGVAVLGFGVSLVVVELMARVPVVKKVVGR